MLGPVLCTSFLVAALFGGTSSTNTINSVAANFGAYGATGGYGAKGLGYYGLGYGEALAGYGAGNDLDSVAGYGGYTGYTGYGGYTGYRPGFGGYGLPYGVNAYKYGVGVPISGALPAWGPWGATRGFGALGGYGVASPSGYKSTGYGPGLYSSAFYR